MLFLASDFLSTPVAFICLYVCIDCEQDIK